MTNKNLYHDFTKKPGEAGIKPFEEYTIYGPVLHKKEQRRYMFLIHVSGKRTSISYARYLMSIKLQRKLSKDEEVDHKDNNKLNDNINNLQILSHYENMQKSKKPKTFLKQKCSECGKEFERRKGQEGSIKGYKNIYCSRSCNGKRFARQTH